MSIYALPNKRVFRPKTMTWQLLGNVAYNQSPTNAAITTSEMPGDPWKIRLDYGPNYQSERLEQKAFFDQFRGPAHIFRCYNVAQPEPRGSMRGAPVVAQTASWGTYELRINTTPNATLKAGDKIGYTLGASPMLIEIAEDAQATTGGLLVVRMVAPARYDILSGSALTWQRPYADFLILEAPVIPFEPRVSPGFSVEAVEFIR